MPNLIHPGASQDVNNVKLGSQEKEDSRSTGTESDNKNTDAEVNKLFSNTSEKITELQRENFELKQRIDQLEDRLKTVERYQQNGWEV